MAKVKLLDPSDTKRRLDRYELIGELASGGMATVFLGRLSGVGGFQRFVAIKRLHPHLAREEEFIEMFLDEARLAARIHHPHVVPILEIGESESGYYLVMEYIEGDTLARIVARAISQAKPTPRSILLRIVIDALGGLHAAHDLTDDHGRLLNLVHRDCSPQNILVGVDGASRLTDFGVARASSRLSNTRADRLKGKLAYMSPEQAKGQDIDRRSDLFAMGTILWEVLTGRRLFKAETEAATLGKVVYEPIPKISSSLPGVHPALEAVVARALEREADQRFQSAAEMADALEQAAREIAASSPAEIGVASPREVASYVQSMLGQDIAAQRESVRAWLSHSEPSMPRVAALRGVPNDVTVKMPLGRSSSPSRSGDAVAVSSASLPRPETTPSDVKKPKLMLSFDDAPEDAEEGETLLMDRERDGATIEALLAREPERPSADEGTQLSSAEPVAPAPARPRRVPQIAAILLGLVLVLAVFGVWFKMRGGNAVPPAPTVAAPTAPSPGNQVAPGSGATAAPTVAVTAAPTADPAPAKVAPSASEANAQPSPPRPGRVPAGKAPNPKASTDPKPPPPPGEEVVNPYR